MELTPKNPNISDLRVFLRAMAEALEQMHAGQRAHGAITGESLVHWLNDSLDALDGERFKQRAIPEEQSNADALHADVHAFVTYSIHAISGTPAAPASPFQADLHRGGEWPYEFLKLLEAVSTYPANRTIAISDLSQALKSEPAPVEPDNQPVNAAAPPVAIPAASSVPVALPKPTMPPPPPTISVALRNATVGKPYAVEPGAIAAAIAKQRGDIPEQARISHLQLPNDSGLVFDEMTGAVAGTPSIPFEGTLSLDYVPSRSERSIPFKVSFLINPDPASLWKDLSPPADAPYQKPSLEHREEKHGSFRVVAASRRGRSHANKGEFRDDDFAIGYAPESGWLVVVVADGAGSAIYSRRGSQIACNVAKDRLVAVLNSSQHNQAEAMYLQHRDWQHVEVKQALRQVLYVAAYLAHQKLNEEVQHPSESLPAAPKLRNYDTTLILMAMKKVGEGVVTATFTIGDGGAGVLPHAGEGIPLSKADSGEHAGQTIFLTFPSTLANTEENLESRFHLALTQEFTGALAMTDGITDPKFPSDAAFADPKQWAELWAELQAPLSSSDALLEWMNFFSPGNHDDRTLVAVLPAKPAAPATP